MVDGRGSGPQSVDGDTYDGPVIAASGGGQEPWFWVAHGTRPVSEVFAEPRPLVARAPLAWASIPTDDATVDRIIESFRDESWRVDDDEPELEGDELAVDEIADPEPAGPTSGATPSKEDVPAAIVRVLGPVEIGGWRQPPGRAIVTELACYLALHSNRPISGDELRSALWPDEAKEASAKSLRTYMSLLRKALGSDRVPPGTAAGYLLASDVRVDWVEFQQLSGPEASSDDLTRALQLIRGRPFAGVPSNTFGWVYTELLLSEMEVAIVRTARRLADVMIKAGGLELAAWAVAQGILAVPSDIGLWELQLSIAGRRGPDELRRARRDAEAVLGEAVDELLGETAQ